MPRNTVDKGATMKPLRFFTAQVVALALLYLRFVFPKMKIQV